MRRLIKIVLNITILTVVVPVVSFGANFKLDGLWEEYGNEELSLIIENADYFATLPNAGELGFDFSWIFKQDSVFANTARADEEPGIDGLKQFKIVSRTTGENFDRQLFKSRVKYGKKLTLEFVNEKDPGEEWNDFQSFNMGFRQDNFQTEIGSFSAGFGEGLVLWRGFEMGGYAENPISPRKSDFLRGYSSTGENSALFGGGMRMDNGWIELILFRSDRKLDARVDNGQIISLQASGIHVSDYELSNKNNLREQLNGGHINIDFSQNLSLGLSGTQTLFSPGFADPDSISDTYAFSGEVLNVMGSNVKLTVDNFHLSGEAAQTNNGGRAAIGKIYFKYDDVHTFIAGRMLSEDFNNFRSLYPDGNESGFTFGVSSPFWNDGVVNLFFDSWKRSWRTSTIDMPPEGYEGSLHFEKKIMNNQYSIRLRHTENNPDFGGTVREQIRFNLIREFGSNALKLRYETIRSSKDGDVNTGHLTTAAYELSCKHTRFSSAITGFAVPDYDCRIYRYEYDVPGMMSIPFFMGSGADVNLSSKSNISKYIRLSLKASLTFYHSRPNNNSTETDKRFALYIEYNFHDEN